MIGWLRKHVNNTDVAIEIIKRFYIKEKDVWRFKVNWYRISQKNPPRDMKITQVLKIPQSSLKDWVSYVYKPQEKQDADQQADVGGGRRGHLEAEVSGDGKPKA